MAEVSGPASLLARTNLTLAVSAVMLAGIAIAALYAFVVNPISEQSANDEAALLVLSAQTWVELPPEARPYFELEMAESHDLIISEVIQQLPEISAYDGYFELLSGALGRRLDSDVRLLVDDELLWVDVPMGGHQLQIGFSPQRRAIQPLYVAVIIVSLGAAIVLFTSWFIVQRIARPLVLVAQQAEDFRGSGEIEPLPETGPRELASLARNFNIMAREISVLLENRTTLLAGISHDLRTPLTRMRLALALLPDDVEPALVSRFERNLESMDELIGDALRFARGAGESAQEFELVPFVREIIASFDQPIALKLNTDARVKLAPSAFRRVLTNLIANGNQHGGEVTVTLTDAEVRVADTGPGIPEQYRDQVFQPFFRLDDSRNRATGGSGLGLAIVHQLCQAHGWSIGIDEAPEGGAEVRVQFGEAA